MLISDEKSGPFVAGADGCSSGWVALILNVRTGASSVQLTDVASWTAKDLMALRCLQLTFRSARLLPARARHARKGLT
jgi:hypothetical protein